MVLRTQVLCRQVMLWLLQPRVRMLLVTATATTAAARLLSQRTPAISAGSNLSLWQQQRLLPCRQKIGCHASAPWLLAAQLLAAQLADWKLTRQGCMCVLMVASILSSAAWSALISSLRLCFSSIILCICLSSCCRKIVGYKQQDSTCLCELRGASCTLMARDTHVPAHPDACHYCGQQTASTQHASTVGLSTKLHLVDN